MAKLNVPAGIKSKIKCGKTVIWTQVGAGGKMLMRINDKPAKRYQIEEAMQGCFGIFRKSEPQNLYVDVKIHTSGYCRVGCFENTEKINWFAGDTVNRMIPKESHDKSEGFAYFWSATDSEIEKLTGADSDTMVELADTTEYEYKGIFYTNDYEDVRNIYYATEEIRKLNVRYYEGIEISDKDKRKKFKYSVELEGKINVSDLAKVKRLLAKYDSEQYSDNLASNENGADSEVTDTTTLLFISDITDEMINVEKEFIAYGEFKYYVDGRKVSKKKFADTKLQRLQNLARMTPDYQLRALIKRIEYLQGDLKQDMAEIESSKARIEKASVRLVTYDTMSILVEAGKLPETSMKCLNFGFGLAMDEYQREYKFLETLPAKIAETAKTISNLQSELAELESKYPEVIRRLIQEDFESEGDNLRILNSESYYLTTSESGYRRACNKSNLEVYEKLDYEVKNDELDRYNPNDIFKTGMVTKSDSVIVCRTEEIKTGIVIDEAEIIDNANNYVENDSRAGENFEIVDPEGNIYEIATEESEAVFQDFGRIMDAGGKIIYDYGNANLSKAAVTEINIDFQNEWGVHEMQKPMEVEMILSLNEIEEADNLYDHIREYLSIYGYKNKVYRLEGDYSNFGIKTNPDSKVKIYFKALIFESTYDEIYCTVKNYGDKVIAEITPTPEELNYEPLKVK